MSELSELLKEKEKLRKTVLELVLDFRKKFPEISNLELRSESYGSFYGSCKSITTGVDIEIKI